MKRLLLGIIPLGGMAAAVMASRRHRELEPELPEHRTVRLLGHEVEALTNRLRDLATRTPDVQRLISDVEELRADVRRLAGDLTDWQRACLNRDMETSGRVSDMERQHPPTSKGGPTLDPGIGGGGPKYGDPEG